MILLVNHALMFYISIFDIAVADATLDQDKTMI
jgi:hypothetical protein